METFVVGIFLMYVHNENKRENKNIIQFFKLLIAKNHFQFKYTRVRKLWSQIGTHKSIVATRNS